MKIDFKTAEAKAKILQLIKDSGSKDVNVAAPAQAAFASIISSSLSQVIDPLSVANLIFTDVIEFTGDSPPEIPIDPYFNLGEGVHRIWSNGSAGGLQYNELSGSDTFRFRTNRIDSAVAWEKKFARESRLDIVQKGINRLMGEITVKSQFNAFTVLARALGNAVTKNKSHVIQSVAKAAGTTKKFQLADVSALMTRMERLNDSWANGTGSQSGTLTDLFISPEAMEQVRAMVYNPMNTTATPNTDESTALGLPDEIRMQVFRSGGASSMFGINLIKLKELGLGQVYNELFRQNYTQTGDGPAWTAATDELIIGVDATMGAFARCINVDEGGSTFQMLVDDQHLARTDKMGYYGSQEEGWVVGNDRAIMGLLY